MINFPSSQGQSGQPGLPGRTPLVSGRPVWAPLPGPPSDPPRISPSPTTPPADAPHRVLRSGWRSNGDEVAAFEREFAAHVGAAEAVAVSCGAAAVELSLRSLRLPHGSRVLVPTLAPCGLLQAVVRAALHPVLIDVSTETGMPALGQVLRAVRSGAGPVGAFLVEHWAGDPADVEGLSCAADVPAGDLVSDVGLALGGYLEGLPLGGAGAACFSFYTTGTLPIGDGGMIVTDDPRRASRLRRARAHGTSPAARRHVHGGHVGAHTLREGGLQSVFSEQSAAQGRDLLSRARERQQRRAHLARRYDERLAGIAGVVLPHRPAAGVGEHGWQLYPLRLERPRSERDAVLRALAVAGVGTAPPLVPLHRLSFCREVSEPIDGDLRGADTLVDQLVPLPLHTGVGDAVVDRVGDVLESALGHRRTR